MAVAQHPLRHGVELWRHHQGNPDLERQTWQGAAKLRRCHADNGKLLPVDANCAADRTRGGAETPFPKAVADHGHRIAALLVAVLFGREEPAKGRLDPQHGKIVSRHQFAPNALRMVFFTRSEERRVWKE